MGGWRYEWIDELPRDVYARLMAQVKAGNESAEE